MLCRKFKNILITYPTNNVLYRPLAQTLSYTKWFGTNMSPSLRLKLFRELLLTRIINVCSRSYIAHSVFKRCRSDYGVNKMFLYFRQVFFRPRTHLLVSATAAFRNTEEKPGPPKKCSRNIKDKEMKKLIKDLERMEDLSKATLFCEGCDKRIVVDSKQKGVQYCDCPDSKPPVGIYDGWVPFMEAEDVIIWRKEYKPGGLYAYKVYGRYKHIKAEDFAMIQVDGAYRKVWDTAVASISTVEREANGVRDQCVLHWVVLWPTLFANRDYVYLRRHKEYKVHTRCLIHKDGIFPDTERCKPDGGEKPNALAIAKKAALEKDKAEGEEGEKTEKAGKESGKEGLKENKVYVIVSRSCTHPKVPETRNAVRVMEYWSHMVITTLNGPDRPGMEFVLTYYDEPAVGGLPTAVTSWAMGRAGPAFLQRMRSAAHNYTAWRAAHTQEAADLMPFKPAHMSYDKFEATICDEDMESSDESPDVEGGKRGGGTRDGSTQTRPVIVTPIDDDPKDGPRVEASKFPIRYGTPESLAEEISSPITTNILEDTRTHLEEVHPKPQMQITGGPQENELREAQLTEPKRRTKLQLTIVLPEPEFKPQTDPSEKMAVPKENVALKRDADIEDGAPDKDSDIIEEQEQRTSWWRFVPTSFTNKPTDGVSA